MPNRAAKVDVLESVDGMVGNYEMAIEEKKAELVVSIFLHSLVLLFVENRWQRGKQELVESPGLRRSGCICSLVGMARHA